MKGKILNKVIASLMVIVLTVSYWGILANVTYATYEELEKQKTQTNNKNVEFDVYFKSGEKRHSGIALKDEESRLYVKLNVKNGYLKQGRISFDNPNFVVDEKLLELEQISEEKEIEIPFSFEKQEQISVDYFSRNSTVNLKATYIDDKAKEREISGSVNLHLDWSENATAKIEQEVEKVIDLGSGRTLVQIGIKDYIVENNVPAENTKIEVDSLKIADTEIEDVIVYASKTTQSNGLENETKFSKDNWAYNKEEGKININVENPKTDDNKIVWIDGEDEFKIIYILKSSNTLENTQIKLYAKGEIKYGENVIAFEDEKDAILTMSGSLINSELTVTDSINKGYMYASSDETIYNSKILTEISYNEMIENLNIEIIKDRFISKNGEILDTNSIIYKRTEINKGNFDELFGEEGKIEIYARGEKIAEINKDTTADEEGNIVINYASEVRDLQIVTSKPIAEGKLVINNIKAVKSQTEYDIETIKDLEEILTAVKINTNISEEGKESRIKLNETVSKAELSMVTNNLSTVVKNENVEMRVLFRTDSNGYDLYKNPSLEIELPNQIRDVNIKSIASAFGEGFSLNSYGVEETEQGNKIIKIALNGEQTKYAMDISQGMSIVIKADMLLDKKSGTSEETVKLRYRNEKAIGYERGGEAEGKIKVEALSGVVAINSMSNYNVEEEIATSLSSREQIGELEILTDKKQAKMIIDVINNHEKEIVNPSIIGRVPFEGNKKETGESLGSTFTAKVVKGIEKKEGLEEAEYKIYYSNNGEATDEIEKAENGWKESIEEVGEVKSYLIKLEDYVMEQGEGMSFEYGVEIPEGLNHNESAYGTYAVEYEIEEEGIVREEKVIAPTVGATTGPGPELEVNLTSNISDNANVQEGQIVRYSVNIKNVGEVEAKNVKVAGIVPDSTIYVKQSNEEAYSSTIYNEYSNIKEHTEVIPVIPVGETYTSNYEVKVGQYEEPVENIHEENINQSLNNFMAKARVSADDLAKELETNSYNNTITKSNIRLELSANFGSNVLLKENDEIRFSGRIINDSSEAKDNVIVTYKIPEGLNVNKVELTKSSQDISKNISNNDGVLSFNIGRLEANERAFVVITTTVNKFAENEYERTMTSKLEYDGNISNEITNYAGAPKISANQTSNKDKYISENSEVEYYVEIANEGKVQARNVVVKAILPDELKIKEIKATVGNEKEKTYTTKNLRIDIPAETTARVRIIAKVSENVEDNKQVSNRVEISGDNIRTMEINKVSHTLTSNKEIETEDGQKIMTYHISGTAWEDSNRDGKKDAGEPKLPNIEVILIDNSTGEIAKKVTSSNEQRTRTNANGEYKFDEVKAGDYIVAFLYDSSKYTVTEYKKAGVLDSENSDVVKTDVKLDGTNKVAGVTQTITVNSPISGIDIGLTKLVSAIFGIDKVVTKIIMQDPKNSKTVDFNNSKLAKMEVDGKYINSTNLVMEYTIKVKNEGTVEGYVKKIIDKIPSQLKFSTDLNKNWYLGSNGEVYNTSLGNTLIKPGETKEVKIVLTKKMSETGHGITHNTVEIADMYNEYGVDNIVNKDTTRIAADIIIGVKTGKEITYITLIFIILSFMSTGIYIINNKVFNKVIDKKVKYLHDDE